MNESVAMIGCLLIVGMGIYCVISNKNKKSPQYKNVSFAEFLFYLAALLSPLSLFFGYNSSMCVGSLMANLFLGNVLTWLRRIYNQKYED